MDDSEGPVKSPSRKRSDRSPSPNESPSAKPSGDILQSFTVRELRKCDLAYRLAAVYEDLKERSALLQSAAEKMEDNVRVVGLKFINTATGKKVDRLVANITRKTNQLIRRRYSSHHEPGPSDHQKSVLKSMLHTAFRLWPPTLFLRWGFDASLGMSYAALALTKDVCHTNTVRNLPKKADIEIVFSQFVPEEDDSETDNSDNKRRTNENAATAGSEDSDDSTKAKEAESSDVESAQCENPSNSAKSQDDTRSSQNTDDSVFESSLVEEVRGGMKATFSTSVRYLLGLMISLLTIMTLILYRTSIQLHRWAGLVQNETNNEMSRDEEMLARLLQDDDDSQPTDQEETEHISERENEWLFDSVVDMQIASLETYPVIGQLLRFLDVHHPVRIAENATTLLKKLKGARGTLVKYMEEDPNYEEEEDPDYQPLEDIAEDSLEYKGDYLDPDDELVDNDVHTRTSTRLRQRNKDLRYPDASCTGAISKQALKEQVSQFIGTKGNKPISPLLSPATTKVAMPKNGERGSFQFQSSTVAGRQNKSAGTEKKANSNNDSAEATDSDDSNSTLKNDCDHSEDVDAIPECSQTASKIGSASKKKVHFDLPDMKEDATLTPKSKNPNPRSSSGPKSLAVTNQQIESERVKQSHVSEVNQKEIESMQQYKALENQTDDGKKSKQIVIDQTTKTDSSGKIELDQSDDKESVLKMHSSMVESSDSAANTSTTTLADKSLCPNDHGSSVDVCSGDLEVDDHDNIDNVTSAHG